MLCCSLGEEAVPDAMDVGRGMGRGPLMDPRVRDKGDGEGEMPFSLPPGGGVLGLPAAGGVASWAGARLAGEPRTEVDLGGRSACATGVSWGVERPGPAICGIGRATAGVLGGVGGVADLAGAGGGACDLPKLCALVGTGGTGGRCSEAWTLLVVAVDGLLEKRRRMVPKNPSFLFSSFLASALFPAVAFGARRSFGSEPALRCRGST